jgi:signal transduction histidine kinase/CheY-like chemotaxis protein
MAVKTKQNNNLENRVLVFMPTGRDSSLVCSAMENAGIFAESCADVEDLQKNIDLGAGAVLLAEEALKDGNLEPILKSFSRQPVWSDVPIIIFAISGQNAERLLETVGTRLNATIVERPIRIMMLISAVRGALRARQRQYQTRDLLHQLEQADRQKDLFLATLSHELRTPLNSMLGWIQLLRGKHQNGQMTVNTEHALEIIERNARMQSELISDILFVSRVITGKLTLNFETLNLISVLQSAIDVMIPSIEAKNIKLRADFETGINQIRGDADRLRQVFWNLLSNAVKFTPPGGSIEIRVKRENSNLKVEIKDSGQGIETEFLPYIFERFRQADNSYTRKVGGLGLGLAIVRYLVELHGGTAYAKSDGLNQGSVFTVTLPVYSEADQQQENPQPSFEAKENKKERFRQTKNESLPEKFRILLVEDNDDSREMLKVLLEQYGIETITADTAKKAFDIITTNPPDILISDVGLPDEDGFELMRRIRHLPPEKGGQIPAIALTGYVSQQDRDRALSVGYQEHLAKPLNADKLLELIKSIAAKNIFSENSNL